MGILLAALAASVLSVTTGATASPSVHVQTSSVVLTGSGTNVTPAPANITLAVASTKTTVVLGTTSGPTDIQAVSIYNNSGFAEVVTVSHSDGTNTVTLFSVTMGIGFTITYDEGNGWSMYDASMNIQEAMVVSGRFLKRTYIQNGTTTFTTSSSTNSIVARLLAGGGGGGGNASTVTAGENGGGGGAGSYAEWNVAVSPSTAYTCAVGAGGAGVSASAGNSGGNTTLLVGGVTCTANGGGGGTVGSLTTGVVGGSGGAISTNGTLNCAGGNGGNSATGWGGAGANSPLGAGGSAPNVSGTGNAAKGYGSGGSGSCATTAVVETGGAGANGILIIDEYS
jgi:hypothetical protein